MINQQNNTSLKILRLPQVKSLIGCSRSWIYLKISEGVFPLSISLGSISVGWLESEIINWLKQRIRISRSKK